MRPEDKTDMKSISSEVLGLQIWRAMLKHWFLLLLFVLTAAMCVITCINGSFFQRLADLSTGRLAKLICMACLTVLMVFVIRVCNSLTEVNNLLRNENRITWCQIWILIAIGLWIIAFIFILGIEEKQKSYIGFGLIGSILAWIFQDKIKGAVAFIHLRMHHLLNIGDWIQVPSKGADGEIKSVTLTTVTLSNWDNTLSTIPISALQSELFINLQNMSDGKTYGRRMLQSFILDTGTIHPLTNEDVGKLKAQPTILECLSEDEIKSGNLNGHLFRIYLHHWLMQHPSISHQPRLMVRWLEQKDSGITLQVYAFLTETRLAAFEWEQSQIIEHILTSMGWFGLRLYQSPSAYDVSNSNIHVEDPVTIRKEEQA